MDQQFCEVENTDPAVHAAWLEKHGFKASEDGKFSVAEFEGRIPAEVDQLLANIRTNVAQADCAPLCGAHYDDRTFVMVCGGPSLSEHLEEVRAKAAQPDKYLVVCSNMTGGYLLENGITPHVHFIIDPLRHKKADVAPGKTSPDTKYWINVACDPAVFEVLRSQGIKPYAFLADFDVEGRAIKAAQEAGGAHVHGMAVIQGGSMAGLRALNLADAMGFRSVEYYGFDATVQVQEGKARPYAYEKKRGEAIIEIQCDRCPAKFDTTLILQAQVNEFIQWRHNMPWIDVKIIGCGLIAHYQAHLEEMDRAKPHNPRRYTEAYKALQKDLHGGGEYGTEGAKYVPTIFHAISQLAKRHGSVSVLDYGSSTTGTMQAVKDSLWIPPCVTDTCYDPFVDEFSAEPEPADLVLCTDVLEHVEPECTKSVLDHIASLTKRLAFFTISLREARKVLADGRNAHINMPGVEFWLRELKRRYIVSEVKVANDTLLVVAQSIEDVKRELRRA